MSLIIRSVNIRFLKTQETLINNLTFEVKKGETITLMGASGCGKSTFLSYICGRTFLLIFRRLEKFFWILWRR